MSTQHRMPPRSRLVRTAAIFAVGSALGGITGSSSQHVEASPATTSPTAMHAHHDRPMTDAAMRQWIGDWYATHPRTGAHATGVPAATFTVFSFGFDADANTADVDTVHVLVGDIVQWTWVDGFHTVTNGTDSFDPNAGLLFDQPIDFLTTEFSFQFQNLGLVPFFCRTHEGLMRGYVDVQAPTDVVPIDARGTAFGFAGSPAPNPTLGATTFRFALRDAGRVRVAVFDVRGRLVTTVVDRVLAQGAYAATWNGRGTNGEPVPAGAYYLRLSTPGIDDSRRVIVTR